MQRPDTLAVTAAVTSKNAQPSKCGSIFLLMHPSEEYRRHCDLESFWASDPHTARRLLHHGANTVTGNRERQKMLGNEATAADSEQNHSERSCDRRSEHLIRVND